jgi:hypothetical protein
MLASSDALTEKSPRIAEHPSSPAAAAYVATSARKVKDKERGIPISRRRVTDSTRCEYANV